MSACLCKHWEDPPRFFSEAHVEQLRAAYQQLVEIKAYDPTVDTESWFVNWWVQQEQAQHYNIGCPDFRDRVALIFIVEAATSLCAVRRDYAVKLLRMALDDIESRAKAVAARSASS